MLRFGPAVICVIAACGHPSERASLSNHAPVASGGIAPGSSACRLDEGGYDYPAFRCVISAKGNGAWLEKVEGSVRFRGAITRRPDGADGFAFDGELFCPWGDCTERVSTVFVPDGAGGYRGAMKSAQSGTIVVTMSYVDQSSRPSYGGGAYGGGAYGGYGYGAGDLAPDDPF